MYVSSKTPSKNKYSCQKTINAFNYYHLIIDQGNLHCIWEQTTSLSTQRILKSTKLATFCFCVSLSSLRCLLQACGNKQHSLHGCGSTFWRISHLQVRLIPIPISNTVSMTCSFSYPQIGLNGDLKIFGNEALYLLSQSHMNSWIPFLCFCVQYEGS
jgi:hypothetical protein